MSRYALIVRMRERDVLEVAVRVANAGCRVWVAGGWAVDALVGTRPASTATWTSRSTPPVRQGLATLGGLGYAIETDRRPARVELAAGGGRWVDLHPVHFAADGHGRQADGEGGCFEYPPGCFTTGRIGDRDVPCLTAEQQLRFRTGYALRDVDRHDIELLTAVTPPVEIRAFQAADRDAVVELSLRAWAPNFASMETVLGAELSRRLHGDDWRDYQARSVIETVTASTHSTWVAQRGEAHLRLRRRHRRRPGARDWARSQMLAVDPADQGRGVGYALTAHATDWLRDAGMRVAMIGTGGDDGHAAARRLYERAGYSLMPIARYFKAL